MDSTENYSASLDIKRGEKNVCHLVLAQTDDGQMSIDANLIIPNLAKRASEAATDGTQDDSKPSPLLQIFVAGTSSFVQALTATLAAWRADSSPTPVPADGSQPVSTVAPPADPGLDHQADAPTPGLATATIPIIFTSTNQPGA